jgi:hypothetical protein
MKCTQRRLKFSFLSRVSSSRQFSAVHIASLRTSDLIVSHKRFSSSCHSPFNYVRKWTLNQICAFFGRQISALPSKLLDTKSLKIQVWHFRHLYGEDEEFLGCHAFTCRFSNSHHKIEFQVNRFWWIRMKIFVEGFEKFEIEVNQFNIILMNILFKAF